MAVQKGRRSKSRVRSHRAKWKINAPGFVECPQCHEPKQAHKVCPECGFYKDREVVAKKVVAEEAE